MSTSVHYKTPTGIAIDHSNIARLVIVTYPSLLLAPNCRLEIDEYNTLHPTRRTEVRFIADVQEAYETIRWMTIKDTAPEDRSLGFRGEVEVIGPSATELIHLVETDRLLQCLPNGHTLLGDAQFYRLPIEEGLLDYSPWEFMADESGVKQVPLGWDDIFDHS